MKISATSLVLILSSMSLGAQGLMSLPVTPTASASVSESQGVTPVAQTMAASAGAVSTTAQEPAVINEVVVSATKLKSSMAELGTNVSVVTQAQLKERNVHTAADAIEGISGVVDVSNPGTEGSPREIRMRSGGASSDQVLVMIDGQPINDIEMGSADLSTISVSNIDRIEVVKGPGSALWGANALGGLINIITNKVGDKPVSSITTSFGSYGEQEYIINACDKHDNHWYSFSAEKDLDGGWRANSHYDANNFNSNMGVDISPDDSLVARILYHQAYYGVPGENNTPFAKWDGNKELQSGYPNADENDTMSYAQIEYGRKFSQGMELSLRTYGNLVDRQYADPDSFEANDYNDSMTGLDVQLNTPVDFMLGWGLQSRSAVTKDLTVVPNKTQIEDTISSRALYLEQILHLGPTVTTLGGRFDYYDDFGTQFDPRLTVVYKPMDNVKLSGNVSRAFRAPTMDDMYSPFSSWPSFWGSPAGDTQGNPNLSPEIAWGYDAGVEVDWSELLTQRVTFYRSDITDLIQWEDISTDPTIQHFRPVNIGNVYNQGMEVDMTSHIGKIVEQSLGYTYLESQGRNNDSSNYQRLEYAPFNKVSYRFGLKPGLGLNALVKFDYTDKVEWVDSYGTKHFLPDASIFGARLGWSIAGSEIFFTADNIFNIKYEDEEFYPLPGTTYHGGVNLTF